MIAETSWHERYRPKDFEAMALDPEVRRQLEAFTRDGVLRDHLLLYGPPGTGKTTIAKVIIKALFGPMVLELNASKDRGIEVIRGMVEMFAKTLPMIGRFKVVFMDEAEGLTDDAQDALRGLMEKYSFQTKFIFTTNDRSKLIAPLRDRCEQIEMNTPPVDECARVLARILKAEGVEIELSAVLNFVANHFSGGKDRTLRTVLRAAQRQWEKNGLGTVDQAVITLLADIKKVFESEQADRLRSPDLVERLRGMEGQRLRLDERRLSDLLRPLGITVGQIWVGVGSTMMNKQGYLLSQFQDAFALFLKGP